MGLDRNLMINDGHICWIYPDGSQHCLTQKDVGEINKSLLATADSNLSCLLELHALVGELLLTMYGEVVPVNKETYYKLKRLYESDTQEPMLGSKPKKWHEGYLAFERGFGLDINPYGFKSGRADWNAGWMEARRIHGEEFDRRNNLCGKINQNGMDN